MKLIIKLHEPKRTFYLASLFNDNGVITIDDEMKTDNVKTFDEVPGHFIDTAASDAFIAQCI